MKSDTEPDSCGCLGSKGAKKSRGTALKWQGGRCSVFLSHQMGDRPGTESRLSVAEQPSLVPAPSLEIKGLFTTL
jgi:hypothetical protein